MWSFFKKNKFLALILLLTFLLRLPSLFEPYWYGDEGIYLTLGLAIKNGLLLYRDIYDNKPPLIYLLAAMAGNLFWFRFILLTFCLSSMVLMFKICQIAFPKRIFVQRLVLVIFLLLLNLPYLEGNITNSEILQILPNLLAIWLLFRTGKTTKITYFVIGLCFGFSLMLKIPAIFDLAAIIFFLYFLSKPQNNLWPPRNLPLIHRLIFLLLGAVLPFLICSLYYFRLNYLKEFLSIIFLQNFGYLSSWETGSQQSSILKSGLTQKLLFCSLVLAYLFFSKKKVYVRLSLLIEVWFAFSLLAATLSNRPYAHYLLQTIGPLCLLVGVILVEKERIRNLAILGILVLLLIFYKTRFWTYPVLPYYRNFFQFALGEKNKNQYFSYFDQKVPLVYNISNFLLTNYSLNDGRIFMWADESYLYPLANKIPTGRFAAAYHIIDFNKYKEVETALRNKPPKIIIVDKNKKDPFPELNRLLGEKYLLVNNQDNFKIYRLRK